jgi:hypothetical protein
MTTVRQQAKAKAARAVAARAAALAGPVGQHERQGTAVTTSMVRQ